MSRTSTTVRFAFYDPAIMADAAEPTATDKHAVSKLADLRLPNPMQSIATFEPGAWLLDGSCKLVPDSGTPAWDAVHVGWLTSLISSGAGNTFSTPPELTVTFGSAHSHDGLFLEFAQQLGVWPTSLQVRYYDAADALIDDATYAPTTWYFWTDHPVADFKSIKVKVISLNKADYHARLKSLDYGKVVYFEDTDIRACSAVEEVDPTSTTLPIGTLELTVHSASVDFNIVDPAGDYYALQERQPLDVFERVDEDQVFMGRYYLDTWSSPAGSEITLRAVDLIGVLDKLPYAGYLQLAGGVLVADRLADMFPASMGITYELRAPLDTYGLYGWVPSGTYRSALQLMMLALGASASCTRSVGLVLQQVKYPPPRVTEDFVAVATVWDYELTTADKGADQSLELTPLVSAVEVTGWNYQTDPGSAVDLLNQSMTAGDYTITFDEPVDTATLTITGATLTVSSQNYVTINVAAPGTVHLTGKHYLPRKATFRASNAVGVAAQPNVLTVVNASTAPQSQALQIAGRLLTYYNKRHVQRMRAFAPQYKAGDSLLIDTQGGRQLWAIVRRMEIDLAGGFTARVEAVGTVRAL